MSTDSITLTLYMYVYIDHDAAKSLKDPATVKKDSPSTAGEAQVETTAESAKAPATGKVEG